MVAISIWWRYGFLLLAMALPWKSYGEGTKLEDIYEQPKEAKVEASSTFFITPREVKQNYNQYHPVNRSVTKMDRFTVMEQHNYMLQNLGNNWTAAQYIFYMLPQRIGATDGLSVYDFYFRQPQDIRYYCTPKSRAYTYFNIVLANLGSFVFDGCYSQRLLDNWYAGVNIYGAMMENEWPHVKDDKKFVDGFPQFDIFTSLNLLDSAYYLFSSFSTMEYATQETGGVRDSSDKDKNNIFYRGNPAQCYRSSWKLLDEKHVQTRLPFEKESGIQHRDGRRNFYLYHQYAFSEPVQLYHELHYSRKNTLCKIHSASLNKFLDFIAYIDEDQKNNLSEVPTTKSKIGLTTLGNEIGIKGDIEQLRLYYGAYYRLENTHFYYDCPKTTFKPTNYYIPEAKEKIPAREHYLGCNTRWNLTQNGRHRLYLDGEYLATAVGYYKLNIAYQNSFLELAYNTIKHKVPYVVQYGYAPYRPRSTSTSFTAPFAQQIAAASTYTLPGVCVRPTLAFKRINHHIYYRQLEKPSLKQEEKYGHCIAQPMQATEPIDLLSWGGDLNFCFSYFHIDNCFTFLHDISNSRTKIFKGYMPRYSYTGRYYFAHQPYKKKMDIEVGINLHFKAAYFADGYDMVGQQFYRQKQFAVQGKPIFDVFGNYRVGNLKISIKFSCINEFIEDIIGKDKEKEKGYFATPFYPGPKSAADVGIHWSFFD